MNLIDIIIFLIVIFSAVLGFKRGMFKETVSFVGFILVIILAFAFKNYVSVFLYENLPFFNFFGILKGVTVLNIVLYEVIAFLIVFSILMIVFKIVLMFTGILELFLKFTVILAIPSKIIGLIIGALKGFVICFIGLYVINLPIFNISMLADSKLNKKILTSTPVLSKYVEKTFDVFDEFATLKDKYKDSSSVNEFNYETLDLFLKYDVVTVNSVQKLQDKGKIKIDKLDILLNKYKEE